MSLGPVGGRRAQRGECEVRRSIAGPLVALALLAGGAPAAAQTAAPGVPERPFAPPTGPHAIGTEDAMWVDSSRVEPFTRDPNDRRRMMVQIWYPAVAAPDAEPAPYFQRIDEFAAGSPVRRAAPVRTNAVVGAPVLAGRERFPVLLYNHGGGWTRFSGTFTIEHLVSHGYVVVSVGHPGFNMTAQFPDGSKYALDTLALPQPVAGADLLATALAGWDHLERHVFPAWVADARFALDRIEQIDRTPDHPLAGRLDLDRIGALGWSFGGATAIHLSHVDPRVKAAVDQDGQLFGSVATEGTARPVMLFHSDPPPAPSGDNARAAMEELMARVQATTRTMLSRSTGDWYDLPISGSTHGHYSDLTLFGMGGAMKLEARRGHGIINAYTLAFCDRYLKGRPSPLLDGASPDFPEVVFSSNRRD